MMPSAAAGPGLGVARRRLVRPTTVAWAPRKVEQKPATIRDAVERYIAFLYSERKCGRTTEQAAERYIYSSPFGGVRVVDLTPDLVRAWRDAIAQSPRGSRRKQVPAAARGSSLPGHALASTSTPASQTLPDGLDREQLRQRKSTSNRVLVILKAALNRALEDLPGLDDRAWRRVKAFRNVDGIRTGWLTLDEQRRLIGSCPPGFRELVLGALFTGARYGELRVMRVGDFFPQSAAIRLGDSKSGSPRTIPLTLEGRDFLLALTQGRDPGELLFQRADGLPWGKSHTFRPLRIACEQAGVKRIAFHELRHTFASQLIMAGTQLLAVAKALGHRDTRMVEKHYGHLTADWVGDQIRRHAPSLNIN